MKHDIIKMFHVTARIRNGYRDYSLNPEKKPYSVDDYVEIISHAMGIELNPLVVDNDVSWSPKHFKGQILKKGDKADILVPPVKSNECSFGITQCEQRFAVVKEACHTLLSVDDEVVGQLSDLVSEIVTGGSSIILNDLPSIIQDEYLGEIAAMELLFPHEFRDGYIEKIKDGKTTPLDIAHEFMVPEKKIINMLSNGMHVGLSEFREEWLDEVENHIYGMEVPTVNMPPRK